jgi:hypothetical protein
VILFGSEDKNLTPIKEFGMSRVLQTSDTFQEDTWRSSWDIAYPSSTPVPPRRSGFSRFIASLYALITPRASYCPRLTAQQKDRLQALESPLDHLARQDPFLFIKSMSG